MSVSCRVCGQADDGRPMCHFQPQVAGQEHVSVHAFCGKIASISYSKPQFEIVNAAQIKNKYKGGHSVQTAMSQTRSASPNGDAKQGIFYLTKEFENKLKEMVDWNAKPPSNGNMASAASYSSVPAGYAYNPQTQQYSRASSKSQTEKRLKRHRSTCPAALWPRIQRAQVERHYLVSHTVPATGMLPRHPAYGGPSAIFAVLGSTGVAYDVTVCKMPSCTCPDHTTKQNTHQNICSHILFVMLKVIGLEPNSNLIYQSALLETELKTVFDKFRARRDNVLYGYAKLPKLAMDPTPQTKQPRKPLVNAICPICFDLIDNNNNDVTYCQAACGTNFHLSCFQMWSSQPASRNPPTTGTTVICHFCRHNWIASPLDHAVYEQHHQQQQQQQQQQTQQQQQYTYVDGAYQAAAPADPTVAAAPASADPNAYQYATQTQQQPQTQYVTQQAQPQYATQQQQPTYVTQQPQTDWYAQQQQQQLQQAPAPAPEGYAYAPAPAPVYQQPVEQQQQPAPAPAPEAYAYQPAPAPAPVYQQQPAPAPAPIYQQHHVEHQQQPAPAPAPVYQQQPAPAPAPVYQHVEHQQQPAPAPAPVYHQHVEHQQQPAPAPAPVYHQHVEHQQQPAPAPAPVYHQHQQPAPAPAPVYHQHQQPAPAPAPVYHQHQQPAPAPAPVYHQPAPAPAPTSVKQEDINGDMNGSNKRQKVV